MVADLTARLFVLTDALAETTEFDPFRVSGSERR